ncbi:MAG: 50S ribosomal protein L32 [Gemmatimonadetes bacterium]|nr:50S ribosomal protein L32 [Gemmatimonadota bacterium]
MAVPKRRTSRRKKGTRNTHKKAAPVVLQACPKCGAPRRSHRACAECGYYGSRQVVAAREA